MNQMRVLLTGGAGFIGSHLAEALLHRGCQLVIVDNLDDFYSLDRKRANLHEINKAGTCQVFEVDICDGPRLREVFQSARPDVVIHLAARAGVRPSIEQPQLYERVNVAGTYTLLELSREFGVRRFIFGSSSSVYGASEQVPFSENDVKLRPISPYAATKLAGELACYTYAHLYSITTICLRFFTVYGPRQRPDLAIHKFTALMEASEPLPVFGDGSMGRDYTYVDDIVTGVQSCLDYQPQAQSAPFDIFNLGNSHPIRLTELIHHLEVATGRKAIQNRKPLQPGDVPLTWANLDKSSRLLGYSPQTRFEEGIRRFVAWYRGSRAEMSQQAAGAGVAPLRAC
jgi:UDP-glucuronate 4-epimerase